MNFYIFPLPDFPEKGVVGELEDPQDLLAAGKEGQDRLLEARSPQLNISQFIEEDNPLPSPPGPFQDLYAGSFEDLGIALPAAGARLPHNDLVKDF